MSRENVRDRSANGALTAPSAAASGRLSVSNGKRGSNPPVLAVSQSEAALVLGISVDSFQRYVAPEVRCVRRGKLRLYAVRELERWLDVNAARWDG